MKKTTTLLGLVLLLTFGCKKENNSPNTNSNRPSGTPDITCTVKGRNWEVYKNDSFNMDGIPGNRAPSVVVTKNGRNLNFSIQKWDGTDTAAIVATVYVNEGLTMLGNYEFNFATDPQNQHYMRYISLNRSMGGPPDEMVNSVGYFKITGHSPDNKIITGEFSATITNRKAIPPFTNSTIQISNGKFTNISYRE